MASPTSPGVEVSVALQSSPVRVIFDTQLRLPLGSRVVDTARETPTWVCAGPEAPEQAEEALTEAGVSVLRIPTSAEGRVDMRAALEQAPLRRPPPEAHGIEAVVVRIAAAILETASSAIDRTRLFSVASLPSMISTTP